MNKKYFRDFWYSLSAKQRYLVRKAYYIPIDIFDKITGNTHKYVPPRGAIYTGSPARATDFLAQSTHQLNLLKQEIDLQPTDIVLDIGCGVGRTAIALSSYLNTNKGRYEGFDVVKQGIDWCNAKIGADYANFNFTYIPLFNDLYNNASLKAQDFNFPYPKNTFSKIFSFSVFTHMQIDEIQNYFDEIHKVLTNEGLAFSTFFLYDDSDEKEASAIKGFEFPVKENGYRLMNQSVKSGNIAINKNKLAAMMKNSNLSIVKIIDGFWKGPNGASEYQDIVVFKKITS